METKVCRLGQAAKACREGKRPDRETLGACKLLPYRKKWWPFGWLQRKPCSELFLRHPEFALELKNDEESQPVAEFFDRIAKQDGQRGRAMTRFRGFVINALLSVAYVVKRYENCCLLATGALAPSASPELDWDDIGFVWNSQQQRLVYPGRDRTAFDRALRDCTKRFVVVFLSLLPSASADIAHANILILDRDTHLLERFDPFQANHSGMSTGKPLDKQLQRAFSEAGRRNRKRVRVRSPTSRVRSFVRRNGLQLRQEMEGLRTVSDDPVGFCVPFCILYLQARLSFPGVVPDVIVRMLQESVERTPSSSLTSFIRTFAEELHIHNASVVERAARETGRRLPDRVVLFRSYMKLLRDCDRVYYS